ncbi:uncharacterized protein Z520_11713 [Fonsecaea multimorphosa CBS 102226]|uniref:Uncharacterized protein n=1 Tax=Fonsecaea multimorphosa CBS 102226 TaxID=1442371 RepID=A0A0D2JH83_9EURO|nr:uncharacterized protein Z520_11713 [Fonsecaea multimorphosa CBS 102226]KIX92537.1 hypothetical protein Z520_11713 [Fonsecaea multimorphosa CBS 102226]OAL17344.1 hypothetical protein AYO22_11711 [Fonsecaea multimorphosa]
MAPTDEALFPKSKIQAASGGVTRLRQLLTDESHIVVCPGVYDGFTARIALAAGFECLYMTGAGTTMSRLGLPDLGLATLNDMRDNASMIAGLDRDIPLIADADTGYGGPLMVGRTVSAYISGGVAALHLEDQVMNKRCGHLRGKQVVEEEVFLSRIKAAVKMRAQTGRDIVVIARTDAMQLLGYDAAVDRLRKALAVGADVAFLEGIRSKEEARQVCKDLYPAPVLLNMAHGGLTPSISVAEAQEMGFRIIIFPGLAVQSVYGAVTKAVKELRETGDIKYLEGGVPSPGEIYGVCGMQEAVDFDLAAGASTYTNGV